METIDFGLLVLRLLIGGLFVAHGFTKFTQRFGGFGLDNATGAFAQFGYRPARSHAVLAGATEIGAGAALALGFGTPLAAAALVGVMVNAIATAHAGKGLWYWNDGWEYQFTLLAVAAALAFTGAGTASLDDALGWDLTGWSWGVGALAAGVGAGAVALTAGRRTITHRVETA
jgi:putative oxidoreductase